MAQGRANNDGNHNEEWERLKMARRLQELFHGRFTQVDAIKLLRLNNWALMDAVSFCFESDGQAIRDALGGEEWQIVENCRRNNALRASALNNRIPAEFRQFACQPCDKVWWLRVPERKRVSRCPVCKNKYDALPRESEWGWAKFRCQCGSEFHGFGAMNKSQSQCYRCGHFCFPAEILPPHRRQRNRRSRNRHSCTAQNCFNRDMNPGAHVPPINLCVHPKSLPRKVVEPSRHHASSGSTVKTFLTQDDLATEFEYEPSLVDIDELNEDEHNSDDDNNNGDNR